jgi:uncharacterized membrane protein
VRLALVFGIGIWVSALFLSPRALSSPFPLVSLSAASVYATGALVCHQRPDRSFHLAGRALPVCARCTGVYAGAALASPIALLAAAASLAGSRARAIALAAALPTIVTWSLEYAGVAGFSNAARFAAALPLGFAVAWLVLGVATAAVRQPLHGPGP